MTQQIGQLLPNGMQQYVDGNGAPYAGGSVAFYVPGTLTPATTWADPLLATPNANPVTLDGNGRAIIYGVGQYRQILKDSGGNTIWDQLTAGSDAIASTVGFDTTADLLTAYPSSVTLANGQNATTAGRTAVNDGGGGAFYYNSSDTTTADNGGTIRVDGAGRRWYFSGTPTPLLFGAKGDGATNDTTAFNNWLSAIAGKDGFIPRATSSYSIPSGLTISGHSGTQIRSDPYAQIVTTQVSGYAITQTNCIECDFEWPIVNPGYSGLLMNSTAANTGYCKVKFERLGGTGKQASKPTDPVANRIGIYILGPSVGNANYYHTIKTGTYVTGFDTGIAFATPASVGAMNSNGNMAMGCQIEAFWFGFYTNSVENQALGMRFYNAGGTDGSHLAECVRIGDGTYASNFNYIQGVAEPANGFNQAFNCLASTLNNKLIIQDNCSNGPTDSGSNDWIIHNQWNISTTFVTQAAPTFRSGTSLTAGGVSGLSFGSGGAIGIFFGSGAPTNSAPKGSLYLRSDGSTTTSRMYVNTDGSTTWTAVTTVA